MSAKTQKETIEYSQEFLNKWNKFCDEKGYVKRQAAHACREAFMSLDPTEREKFLFSVMTHVQASRQRRRR